MGQRIFNTNEPFLEVGEPEIGKKYHLVWARKHGMVWILTEICGENVILMTPRTKKRLVAKTRDLRHTRAEQSRILQNKIKT